MFVPWTYLSLNCVFLSYMCSRPLDDVDIGKYNRKQDTTTIFARVFEISFFIWPSALIEKTKHPKLLDVQVITIMEKEH